MARTVAERADVVPLLAEVFREYGFEGASLARLCAGVGLGKGSLYHFFPGGKDEMADAVLAHIDTWFRHRVFAPLQQADAGTTAIGAMFDAVDAYFISGQKVCLVGVFALGSERDRFASQVGGYFSDWVTALASALRQSGVEGQMAQRQAQETVAAIQGALVLARALQRPAVFKEALETLRQRLIN